MGLGGPNGGEGRLRKHLLEIPVDCHLATRCGIAATSKDGLEASQWPRLIVKAYLKGKALAR